MAATEVQMSRISPAFNVPKLEMAALDEDGVAAYSSAEDSDDEEIK